MSQSVTLVQMASGGNFHRNLAQLRDLLPDPKGMVLLPEMWSFLVPDAQGDQRERFALDHQDEVRRAMALYSKNCFLVAGSSLEIDGDRLVNRSRVYDHGQEVAVYDKIHLFDNGIEGDSYRESETVRPGHQLVVTPSPMGSLGLSTCYDLRFPSLYEELQIRGAMAFSCPAAFTRKTGEAHWSVLLQARAIEQQAYVLAPNQCSEHPPCHGHSLIVDPWGSILAEGGREPGLVQAELDLELQLKIRETLPALQHRRPLGSS